MPGFGLTLGYTLFYLGLFVLLPLSVLFVKAAGVPIEQWVNIVTSRRVAAALALSFGAALLAALANAIFGTLVAWVLVRYRFWGRRFVDAIIDLPFALPTAVAGIALTTLYVPTGWLGAEFSAMGMPVAFTRLGVFVALVFVGFPFVVRTIQPVLEELEVEYEEAAATLGAGRVRIFLQVILPCLWPAVLTGFTLAFARGLGEYGSVVFISGNMPFKTEIVPLLIMSKLEQFDLQGATVLAVVMLIVSFILLLTANHLQAKLKRSRGDRSA